MYICIYIYISVYVSTRIITYTFTKTIYHDIIEYVHGVIEASKGLAYHKL